MGKLWRNPDAAERADRLIEKLLARMTVDGSLDLSWENKLLKHGLSALADSRLRYEEVSPVLRQMQETRASGAQAFETSLRSCRRVWRSAYPWTLLLPLDMKLGAGLPRTPQVTVLGVRFGLMPISRALRQFDESNVEREIRMTVGHGWTPPSEAALVISTHGSSLEDAWQRGVEPAFELLRGLIEASLSPEQHDFGFSSNPRGLARLPHPDIVIGSGAKGACVVGRWPGERQKPYGGQIDLDRRTWHAIQGNARTFRRRAATDSTLEIVGKALRLHALALDEEADHRRLLGFWRVAEALTMAADLKGSTQAVAERLYRMARSLEEDDTPGVLREVLLQVGHRRNEVVHAGDHSQLVEEQVLALKLACDRALRFLLGVRERLPTREHLKRFHEFSVLPSEEVQTIGTVLRVL